MSILIKGMKMPDCGYVCLKVFANGEVLMTKEHRGALVITGIREKVGTAVPVPPHGRLIDVDYADEYAYDELEVANSYLTGWEAARAMQKIYRNAPTIIPADKEGERE